MTTRSFLLVATSGLAGAAACLALAEVLDSNVLAVAGLAFLLCVLVARERWTWTGRGRQWALTSGVLVAAVAVAFLTQRLIG